MKKHPGQTEIEVKNEVHMFVVDDQDHPQILKSVQNCRDCQAYGMM